MSTQTELAQALAADAHLTALINSLPKASQEALDRMLYELPLSNANDNWLTRMSELKRLGRDQAVALIDAWAVARWKNDTHPSARRGADEGPQRT